MALKLATVVMYMLLSGCLAGPYYDDDNEWAPARDQGRDMYAEDDAVKDLYGALKDAQANEAGTQEAVDNDPYWNWGNDNDVETESDLQDFSDWDDTMDGQQQDFSDWVDTLNGQTQDSNDWEQPAPEENVGMQENSNLDWGWGEMQEDGESEAGNTDTSNPGEPAEEQELSPDDIMVQFFNQPGDPQVLQQEVDWNDRDFLKEELEANGQETDWNIPEENEAMQQDMDWNGDTFPSPQDETGYFQGQAEAQDDAWVQPPDTFGQEYTRNDGMPSNANIEELWNELSEIQQPQVQSTLSEINAQIEAIYKQMEETQGKLAIQTNAQKKETECLKMICEKDCPGKEVCVRKNEHGTCVCCKEADTICLSRKEAVIDEYQKKIDVLSAKLSGMEEKLVELTDKQKEAQKSNP